MGQRTQSYNVEYAQKIMGKRVNFAVFRHVITVSIFSSYETQRYTHVNIQMTLCHVQTFINVLTEYEV